MERETSSAVLDLEHGDENEFIPRDDERRSVTELVCREYMERLLPLAKSILGCDHQACDAVQEAFVALWKEPVLPPNPWAWLVRAVVFRSRHARRCRLRRVRHEDRAADLRPSFTFDRPDRELENQELRAKLEAAIAV
jgi:DNA-directed RNA polymerase specialized sigma24 family protein